MHTAEDFVLAPVAANEHDWCDHIVLALPLSDSSKRDSNTASPDANVVEIPISPGSTCELIGAPAALDAALIYTDEEISLICDALIGPLAKEIHKFDRITELPAQLVSDGAKHGLGKLLRYVCAKVVPLTRVLQMRRETVQKLMDSLVHGDEQQKIKKTVVNQGAGKSSSVHGRGLNLGSAGKDDRHPLSSDCHKNQMVSVWEEWDPWLFFEKAELASLSATCCQNNYLVSEWTPFGEFTSMTCNGADEDEHEDLLVNTSTSNATLSE